MNHHRKSPIQLQVYFEDQHLIVLDKPAGLLSQGEARGDENLVDLLRERFGRSYVGLVHRLDRNTSGLMVVAKRTKAAQRLTAALQEGRLQRAYLAWVHGTLEGSGHWQHELLKDEQTNTVRVVPAGTAGAKSAGLSYAAREHVTFHGAVLTLLELTLDTGRSHQIRVQAAAAGHPLLGDIKYGGKLDATGTAAGSAFGRPALHSHRLVFPHPMSGEELTYESPLPADMAAVGARR